MSEDEGGEGVIVGKWYKFSKNLGSRQKRPPVKRWVLVAVSTGENLPVGVAVGYMKNAAGDKQSPYFVIPGLHVGNELAWCDCLPDNFNFPVGLEEGE